MNANELKTELVKIFGDQIEFNKDFDAYAEKLKEDIQLSLVEWCMQCKDDIKRGHTPDKLYLKHLYVFFRKIGNQIRAILIKVKNQNFIEIHLADHKYYDDKRTEMGFKKTSYYGS